ncbi:hypothetical protein BFP72_03250 [Reichenbachiella sp. 5M10]|uniref:DUF4365 domain-containing protein n=1 Tax=Reichenbachiella sp. 5M10 TaxID=1889772 RepID=UPI000C15896F|nr:DUF4365 domain-containing protein [Reichenbachiella sp. 5M10]PIB34498.1 hypothetical protein BFP72_03250 [Reichenbachiella sp. 5M10]
MARKKQRVFQHEMEDESYKIIKDVLPNNWVIREFNRPDYGVDIVIEIFDKVNEKVSEALGEYLYVQVKSVQCIEIKTEKIYPVGNVAKVGWREDKSKYFNIDVIKFVIDTDSIYTIQSLGSSISFLLFVVDIDTRKVYFICLNDYIDKILFPRNPNYGSQKDVTITIPVLNELSLKHISKPALEYYGKRAKMLSAFAKFAYQKNEINHLLNYKDFPLFTYRDSLANEANIYADEIKTQVLYFIEQIEYLEIWDYQNWQPLPLAKTEIKQLKKSLLDGTEMNTVKLEIIRVWHGLTNLGNMYEELTREWYMPKYLSFMMSYPEVPESIEVKK